jgi:hypothetical protein
VRVLTYHRFMFLGICGGTCGGFKEDKTIGLGCYGYCAHANMVTKRRAKHCFMSCVLKNRVCTWIGRLFYQCCRTAAVMANGTALTAKSSMLKLTCYKLQITCRLGNLAFQYAALVVLCVKKSVSPTVCASLSRSLSYPMQAGH